VTKRFDSKKYADKQRVFPKVPGTKDVRRVLVWRDERDEYLPPVRGGMYQARRWERSPLGKRVRVTKTFDSLPEARDWERGLAGPPDHPECLRDQGPPLRDVIEDWKRRRYPAMSRTTCAAYDNRLRLHFGSLLDVPIRALTPAGVDAWIAGMIELSSDRMIGPLYDNILDPTPQLFEAGTDTSSALGRFFSSPDLRFSFSL
jgi:hypothetical protein